MGTPAFACPILDTLLAGPDPVVGVVTQPDRPRGRGLSVTPPEVKVLAQQHGLPVLQPDKVKVPAFEQALRALAPDLIVVAAYGRILPRAILELPPHGCINVHASLLPRRPRIVRARRRRLREEHPPALGKARQQELLARAEVSPAHLGEDEQVQVVDQPATSVLSKFATAST